MLALAWPWNDESSGKLRGTAQRLASSLCAGIGGNAASVELDGLHFAWRPLRANPALVTAWRPARLPGGQLATFHGYFDNAAELAAELGTSHTNLAQLYGRAVQNWGEDADSRVIGEYCAAIADIEAGRLRLSRSPLRAPPLIYYHDDAVAIAASVPRAIFAAGVPRRLNEVRAADSALINFTDLEASWFEDLHRVPLGSVVELERGKARRLRTYYDLLKTPKVRMNSAADYIARAGELLDEGVKASLAGFGHPGATLSSGLDSSQVVVRAVAALPPGQSLPTFTFHPESGWDGGIENGMNGNERPMVERFAAMHPRLETHFTANEGYEHDYRWNDMFLLMGGAPSGLSNMYVFHGIWTLARERGCDVLLLAEWGNFTFSDKGEWAFVEYLVTGRWRQLWLAIKRHPNDPRSLLRRFLALSIVPLLPDWLWQMLMRLWHPTEKLKLDLISPLRASYREASGAEQRRKDTGFLFDRYQPRNRQHAQELLFRNLDGDSAEIFQAFEQMYGLPCRDPMAYRPFVEFCFGLPTELFVRDGELRWLAKQMAKGIMPEEQRINRLNGRWDSDWHLRIGRRRESLLAELDRIEADVELSAMIDVPRLRAALMDFPDRTVTDKQKIFPIEFTVMRGLLTTRFINFVRGSNQS